jgi:hypothetical protein
LQQLGNSYKFLKSGVVAMRALTAIFFIAGMLLTVASAQADRRVAFVVGNGAYKHVSPLPNPSVDARAMASLLRNVGFEVVAGEDLDRDGMTGKLREFALKAQGADMPSSFLPATAFR